MTLMNMFAYHIGPITPQTHDDLVNIDLLLSIPEPHPNPRQREKHSAPSHPVGTVDENFFALAVVSAGLFRQSSHHLNDEGGEVLW